MARKTHLTRRERFSAAALRQQQLAWMLYVSEGHLANLEHARAVNNFAMLNADVELLNKIIATQRAIVDRVREHFSGE